MSKRLITIDISPATATHCGWGCKFYDDTLNAGSGGCIAFGEKQPMTDERGYLRLPECIAAEQNAAPDKQEKAQP